MARPVPVRGLTEGAVLAAFAAILAVAAKYLPLVGAVAVFLCPLPLTVLTLRHGLRVAFLAAVVATGIGTMVGGVLIGGSIAVAFAPSGIAMGIGIRRQFSATRIWLLTAGVAMASVVASAGLALLGLGIDPRQELAQLIHLSAQSQQTALQMYERLGINTAATRVVAAQMQQVMEVLPRLLPFLLITTGASTAYFNLLVGGAVLRRLRVDVPAFPPISMWRVPSWFLWTLPAGMACLLVSGGAWSPPSVPLATMRVLPPEDVAAIAQQAVVRFPLLASAGTNLVWLANVVFSLLGLITGWVLMERYAIPRWYRWIVIYLSMSPVFSLVALLLGLADATYDLRSRWRQTAATSITPARDPVVK